jgi:hypothetical protein
VVVPDEVISQEPVLAAGRKPATSPVKRAAAAAPAVELPKPGLVTLTAAADVPGFPLGQPLDGLDGVVSAVIARAKTMPRGNLAGPNGGVRQRFGTAVIRREFDDPLLVQGRGPTDDFALVEHAANERRLPGGSLVASIAARKSLTAAVPSGWCAPSETLYDLCEFHSVEGMLDVPEFQVRRGGIRYTDGPNFDDIYNNVSAKNDPKKNYNFVLDPNATGGFDLSTTGGGAAITEKPCAMVECTDFEDIRLSLLGFCVKSPILMEMTYPELVRRFVEGVLVAHRHRVNEWMIDQIVKGAGSVQIAEAATPSRTVFNLQALEFYAMGMRYKYRLPLSATMELVAPAWLREIIRMDMAMENCKDRADVSNADVDRWFTSRDMRVQWVYDWQDITVDANSGGLPVFLSGGTGNPALVNLLMYPAGSWARGVGDTFSIDNVYDSANLADNVYTALFTEESMLMVNRCYSTVHVQIPLCISGVGVADVAAACFKQAP